MQLFSRKLGFHFQVRTSLNIGVPGSMADPSSFKAGVAQSSEVFPNETCKVRQGCQCLQCLLAVLMFRLVLR